MMLAALGFTAVFTAGLIERLLDRRLVAVLGPRGMPRKDHVVVVGLGQVGLRLCMMLRGLGTPVVAVERDPDADNVRRAKRYDIPVVIGRGNSRAVLRRLSLARARALAAVTSDEIENISAAMAALAMREDLRTVLRAGSGDVMDETRPVPDRRRARRVPDRRHPARRRRAGLARRGSVPRRRERLGDRAGRAGRAVRRTPGERRRARRCDHAADEGRRCPRPGSRVARLRQRRGAPDRGPRRGHPPGDGDGALELLGRAVALGRATRAGDAAAPDRLGGERLLDSGPLLQASIDRRNPYIDPLSFVQIELLRRRASEDRLARVSFLAINGLASGLRNTG